MVGPYQYCMCELEEETISHVLDAYMFASNMWYQGASKFQRSDQVRKHFDHTIIEWTSNPFRNPIMNRLWEIFPHFVL